MLKGKYYRNSYSPHDYQKKDKILKIYCVTCGECKKVKKPKISYLLEKTLVLSIICSKYKNKDELFK